MKKILFETCCESAYDVIRSEAAGADRAELNSCLYLGGLTPSLGSLKDAVANTSGIKIITMVRPRHGGFCYDSYEHRTMLRDAEIFLENGSQGIVFGYLNEDGTVDKERCREMITLLQGSEAVFHRAFDLVPDWKEAMEILIDLGVKRILTSGQRGSAFDGRLTIKEMIDFADGRIEILPGAGIRAHNASQIIKDTGASQLHISARKAMTDLTAKINPYVSFVGNEILDDSLINRMDADEMKRSCQRILAEL